MPDTQTERQGQQQTQDWEPQQQFDQQWNPNQGSGYSTVKTPADLVERLHRDETQIAVNKVMQENLLEATKTVFESQRGAIFGTLFALAGGILIGAVLGAGRSGQGPSFIPYPMGRGQ